MMRLLIIVMVAAAANSACAFDGPAPPAPPWQAPLARDSALAGQIRDGKNGRTLTPEALIARLAVADFVILGERHDNPDHHRLQAWLTERLLDRRPYAVAFEMIDSSQAAKLAAYLAGNSSDATGLGAALHWHNSGWPEWRQYQPIAAAALSRRQPILAANLPPDVARAIAREGRAAVPASLAQRLRLTPDNDTAVLAEHAAEIETAHCGVLPARSLAPFALAQYVRDAEMARVMADHWSQTGGHSGVILIAGAGHGRTDRGVPFHLARMAPAARVLSLAFVEASDQTSAMDFAALPYDLVWMTARMDDTDPCAKLKPSR